MSAVTPARPPSTYPVTNVGRYAYLSKMVGMPVTYGKKPTKGVIMGCWTSDDGEPQFVVLGLNGGLAIVNITEVRFYRADAIVQDAHDSTDDTLAKSEARHKL